jgi:hypothetical protein
MAAWLICVNQSKGKLVGSNRAERDKREAKGIPKLYNNRNEDIPTLAVDTPVVDMRLLICGCSWRSAHGCIDEAFL